MDVDFDGSGNTVSMPSVSVLSGESLLVGYDYSIKITPMPASIVLPDGAWRGYPQRIVRVILESDNVLAYTVSSNMITVQRNTNGGSPDGLCARCHCRYHPERAFAL